MKFRSAAVSAVVLVSVLAGCAHQAAVDRKVEEELKVQRPVSMGGPMAAESFRLINESPDLDQGQKDKLIALHSRMAAEVMKIRQEEGKLKMVFFKTLLNPKSDEREINNLKTRILAADRKKTQRMLSGFEEAREILGRKQLPEDSQLYRAFTMDRSGQGDFF